MSGASRGDPTSSFRGAGRFSSFMGVSGIGMHARTGVRCRGPTGRSGPQSSRPTRLVMQKSAVNCDGRAGESRWYGNARRESAIWITFALGCEGTSNRGSNSHNHPGGLCNDQLPPEHSRAGGSPASLLAFARARVIRYSTLHRRRSPVMACTPK